MQAQVSTVNDQTPIAGFRNHLITNSNFADRHKEIYQCKLKLPTPLDMVSFIRKT